MPRNTFSDNATRRIAAAVRAHEREPRDLTRDGVPLASVPFEICRFEMTAALELPEVGPGCSWGYKLHWNPHLSHEGFDYGTLLGYSRNGTDWFSATSANWTGNYDTGYSATGDSYQTREEVITILDPWRNHSKMASVGNDVGAHGLAWKPHDLYIEDTHRKRPAADLDIAYWEIIFMQTPAPFYGRLQGDLDFSDAWRDVTVFALEDLGHRTLGGYDPFGDGYGTTERVYNPPAQYNDGTGNYDAYQFAGEEDDVVYCEWHMRKGRYYIRGVEPNRRGWSSSNVITSVSVDGGGHVTGTTSETIWHPPWATS